MRHDRASIAPFILAIFGAVLFGLFSFRILVPGTAPFFGTDIYNAYFLLLLDGRFDLPVRLIRWEGHYLADGTALMYHGVSPLITRAVLYPFVDLHEFPVAAFSIWFWAVIGTGFYHATFQQVFTKFSGVENPHMRLSWAVLIAVWVWLCGPGLLVSANSVLYHEPISVAYACVAALIFILSRCLYFDLPIEKALIPLALLSAVLLHARPHLALGGYFAVVALSVLIFYSGRRIWNKRIAVSMTILFVAGVGLIYLNAARFGEALTMHGQIGETSVQGFVQHGPMFFVEEHGQTPDAIAFEEHGHFNAWRIVPNFLVYTFDFETYAHTTAAFHRAATEQVAGYARIELPRIGMFFHSLPWVVLSVASLFFLRASPADRSLKWILFLSVAIGSVLMASYLILAFRYRIEIWPLFFVISVIGLPGLMGKLRPELLEIGRLFLYSALVTAIGVIIALVVGMGYARAFQELENSNYGAWNMEYCTELTATKGFSVERQKELCVDPLTVFGR